MKKSCNFYRDLNNSQIDRMKNVIAIIKSPYSSMAFFFIMRRSAVIKGLHKAFSKRTLAEDGDYKVKLRATATARRSFQSILID